MLEPERAKAFDFGEGIAFECEKVDVFGCGEETGSGTCGGTGIWMGREAMVPTCELARFDELGRP